MVFASGGAGPPSRAYWARVDGIVELIHQHHHRHHRRHRHRHRHHHHCHRRRPVCRRPVDRPDPPTDRRRHHSHHRSQSPSLRPHLPAGSAARGASGAARRSRWPVGSMGVCAWLGAVLCPVGSCTGVHTFLNTPRLTHATPPRHGGDRDMIATACASPDPAAVRSGSAAPPPARPPVRLRTRRRRRAASTRRAAHRTRPGRGTAVESRPVDRMYQQKTNL